MSNIPTASTPVRQPFLMLTVSLKHKKQDCSTNSAPNEHWGKRAHSGTKEANEARSSKTVPAFSHSFDQPESESIKPPSSPAKNDTVPDDGDSCGGLRKHWGVMVETLLWASVRTTLTRVVMSLNQTESHGRALLTPI